MNVLMIGLAILLFLNTSWVMSVCLVFGAIIFFLVNLIVRQESMLYVPCVMPGMQMPSDNPEGMQSPSDKGLSFEEVWIHTRDGVRIHGWFMPCGDEGRAAGAPTLLFCHANAGNIGMRVPNFAEIIEKLEMNIFAFDYRGYGCSEGTPTETGLIEDVLSAWRWLQNASDTGRLDGKRVFVFGRSLGGAVAVALASELQRLGPCVLPCGLILENTFISISAVVDELFPLLAYKVLKDRFLRLKWESLERIRDMKVPVLFLTGLKDEMIPPWHSAALCAGAVAAAISRQATFEEGTHNDTWECGGEAYWEAQATFLRDCCSADFPRKTCTNGAAKS